MIFSRKNLAKKPKHGRVRRVPYRRVFGARGLQAMFLVASILFLSEAWLPQVSEIPSMPRLSSILQAQSENKITAAKSSHHIRHSQESDLPLQNLAAQGRLQRVKLYLRRMPKALQQQDQFGKTALHYAAAWGHGEVVLYLLSQGADIYAVDRYGQTALHHAAEWGREAIVQSLMAHLYDPNHSKMGNHSDSKDSERNFYQYLNLVQNEGRTALQIAAIYGQERVVRMLLKAGALAELRDYYGWTAENLAFKNGHIALGQLLKNMRTTKRQTDDQGLEHSDSNGQARQISIRPSSQNQANELEFLGTEYPTLHTPLPLLSWPGTSPQVYYLRNDPNSQNFGKGLELPYSPVKTGRNSSGGRADQTDQPNTVETLEQSGKYPLLLAVRNQDLVEVRRLLQAGHEENAGGWSDFLFAVAGGNPEVLQAFLQQRGRQNLRQQSLANGWGPLQVAARSGYVTSLKFAIDTLELDINSVADQNGKSALLIAIQAGQSEAVDYLLSQGASVTQADTQGAQALHYAVLFAEGLAERLLEQSEELSINVNDQDIYGQTPLYLAAWTGKVGLVEMLLGLDADVYLSNKQGWQATAAALQGGYSTATKVFKLILASLAAHNKQNLKNPQGSLAAAATGNLLAAAKYCGETLLHLAAKRGNSDFIHSILQLGADVNLKSQSCEETPLHVAVVYGKLTSVELLLHMGADIEARDKKGNTAVLLAASQGNTAILQLLWEKDADFTVRNHAGLSLWDLVEQRNALELSDLAQQEQQRLKDFLQETISVQKAPLENR